MAKFYRSWVCMISAVVCMLPRWVWHFCNLSCVYALFSFISIARYALSLREFAFEGTNYAKVCLKTFLCFLQLSDRAYVSLARCISFFLLVVLVPHDSNVAVYAQVCWLFRMLYVPSFGFVQGRPCGEIRTRTKMLFVIRMCLLYLQTVLITTGPGATK